MIKIEKISEDSSDYLLHVGNKQSHKISKQDLKNLHHCLTQTIDKGAEETPEFRVRILNDSQFEVPKYNDGRSALWIGEQKWHLNHKEEGQILEIIEGILGNNNHAS